MQIIIPMAGYGSRFEKAGYLDPKPLIDINGKPMIQVVVENLNLEANYIFIVLKEHYDKFNLGKILPKIVSPNNCKIVIVNHVTQGAACTVLLAKHIFNDEELLIANSDQWVDWNSDLFIKHMNENNADGGILTFTANDPKWSFVKLNSENVITEVAEKNPISNIASVGIYYFKSGTDFITYAEQMINKNIRTKNEFYLCPVFNELIADQKKILHFEVDKMYGLGTPEDLDIFLKAKIEV